MTLLGAMGELVITYFHKVSRWQDHLLKTKKAYRALAICGQHKANLLNLRDARDLLLFLYPERENDIGSSYNKGKEMIHSFLPSKDCTSSYLPHVRVSSHWEYNPDLPAKWPNWVVKFNHQR